jgi:hypothetical protein
MDSNRWGPFTQFSFLAFVISSLAFLITSFLWLSSFLDFFPTLRLLPELAFFSLIGYFQVTGRRGSRGASFLPPYPGLATTYFLRSAAGLRQAVSRIAVLES